jgi:hypothetical protein
MLMDWFWLNEFGKEKDDLKEMGFLDQCFSE